MAYPYLLLDVFTEEAFGGNPLAVFLQAEAIDRSLLQPIARELNLTETAFVYPAKSPEAAASLRIFTPDAEVPFAGHPIVGAAFALEHAGLLDADCGETVFEVESTSVPVRLLRSEGGSLLQATMTQQRPVFLGQFPRSELVAAALGLQTSDLTITGLPCEVVSTGLPVHIVPLGGLDAMRRIALRPSLLKDVKEALGFSDLFVFCFETEDPTATVHCRMFAPGFGIPEDPATGAASGALGAYLVRRRVVPERRFTRIIIEQGIEMGRPSRIFVEVECEGNRIEAVRVGGRAVVVGEGALSL